jgi:hypothetical protein
MSLTFLLISVRILNFILVPFLFFISCVYVCVVLELDLRALALARQVPYHLSHVPSFFFFF